MADGSQIIEGEVAMATDESPAPISPESTRRGHVAGVPITLADGREWTLAYDALYPICDDCRDLIFNAQVLKGSYSAEEVELFFVVAYRLLRLAHELDPGTAASLLRGLEDLAVVRPVEQALFGDAQAARTYSTWARASLRINGIDPETLPPREFAPTLRALEDTGRALPKAFIASVAAAEHRARRDSMIRGLAGRGT
jgi:hypothetical protein